MLLTVKIMHLTGTASYSSLFVYETGSGLYRNAAEFSGIDSPSLREHKQCIYGYSRGGAASHYVNRCEYVDGILKRVARLSTTVKDDEVEITDEQSKILYVGMDIGICNTCHGSKYRIYFFE